MIKFIKFLKISITPPSLVYPIPLIPLLIYFAATNGKILLNKIAIIILLVFLFYSATNSWNHINDIEEDLIAGRFTAEIARELKDYIIPIVITFYLLSILLVLTVCKNAILPYLICIILSWMYSDKIILGKKFKRLKDNYLTEVLTFLIIAPSFVFTIWLISIKTLSIKSVAISITLTAFAMTGVFLKDIKDITSDSEAGLKTLGVVFDPSTLLKYSIYSFIIYYISIAIFVYLYIYPFICLLSLIPSLIFIYTLYLLKKYKWIITISSVKAIKCMILSGIMSIFLLLVGFII